MSTLFWPGDQRAGDVFSDSALVTAMTAVETAWLRTLVRFGVAPTGADTAGLAELTGGADLPALAEDAEAGGNPVIPLLGLLRARLTARGGADGHTAARWLHRGLTSQDVLDTAMMLMARECTRTVEAEIRAQVGLLAELADTHRATAMVGRTLTQSAVPITLGVKVAGWLQGVLDAVDDVGALRFPAQFGGAAGNLSGATALTGDRPAATVGELLGSAASALDLYARSPWHTNRAPVTRFADALAGCTTAWGHVANDVLVLARPEIGELSEPAAPGRGTSSAMPQKVNPVLSVLIRRAALASPGLVATLHLAAADVRDERPDGSWHLEWQPLQLLARHVVTAASHTTELLRGLRVDATRLADNLAAARPGVDAEQVALRELRDHHPRTDRVGSHVVVGADHALVDAACERAATWLEAGR